MRRTLIAATTLVSAAALMSGAGLALANTRAASPDIFRTEHFRIISTSAPTAKQSVIATGAFTAGGSEIIGQTHDKAYLYRGTFRITRHITHKSAPVPPKNCIVTETERGTYTLSDGTGRYKGLRGSGSFSLHITTILASPGNAQCGRMVAFQQIIYESGRVNR
jgi:hypothetical protein